MSVCSQHPLTTFHKDITRNEYPSLQYFHNEAEDEEVEHQIHFPTSVVLIPCRSLSSSYSLITAIYALQSVCPRRGLLPWISGYTCTQLIFVPELPQKVTHIYLLSRLELSFEFTWRVVQNHLPDLQLNHNIYANPRSRTLIKSK